MEAIEIKDLSSFSIKQILDCGQIFRYILIDDRTAVVVSRDKLAYIKEDGNSARIYTNYKEYFENYFDLNTNYTEIKNDLMGDEFLCPCCKYGYGIRILRQDFFEMLVSFIISANNNIKRIKHSVNMLSKMFGEKKLIKVESGDCENELFSVNKNELTYFAFPTLVELKKATVEDFVKAGLGYRAVQLYETIQRLNEEDITNFKTLTNEEKHKFLISLKGVGEKVANCIMLFSEHDMSAFPVDTWIEKVYIDLTKNTTKNRKEIEKELKFRYKKNSGYAQQYFFYYYRENK